MAQISSYSTLTPQLGDKVLGSNTTDSSGNAVTGNPTCQFTLTSVKDLVDQQFIQELFSSSSLASQAPGNSNTVHPITFGIADTTSTNVHITNGGRVTFVKEGTYYITQEYNLVATQGSQLQTMFRTVQDGTTQVGSTCMQRYTCQASTDAQRIVINQMVTVIAGTYYDFQMIWDANGGNDGYLKPQTNNNLWTTVPGAQITISKLV